jgi:hypothetical protein
VRREPAGVAVQVAPVRRCGGFYFRGARSARVFRQRADRDECMKDVGYRGQPIMGSKNWPLPCESAAAERSVFSDGDRKVSR